MFKPGSAISDTNPRPVGGSAPGTAAASIAAGAAVSGDLDLGDARLHSILIPAAWTAAALSFEASPDGTTWGIVYDKDGAVEIPAAQVGASRVVLVDPAIFFGFQHIRVRSGTAAAAVNQVAIRALVLLTVQR